MDVARGLRRLLSAAAVTVALLLLPGPALAQAGAPPVMADCQMAPPLQEAVAAAEFVFVGRVSAVDNGGRSADVEVIEVWKGDIADRIVVDGGIDPARPAEDDRSFDLGATYIFLPSLFEGHFVDSICSATTPWDEASMAALRPGGVVPGPSAAPAASGPLAVVGELAAPLLVALLVGGAAFALAVVVGRRREG